LCTFVSVLTWFIIELHVAKCLLCKRCQTSSSVENMIYPFYVTIFPLKYTMVRKAWNVGEALGLNIADCIMYFVSKETNENFNIWNGYLFLVFQQSAPRRMC
jgi:hypothetical protein